MLSTGYKQKSPKSEDEHCIFNLLFFLINLLSSQTNTQLKYPNSHAVDLFTSKNISPRVLSPATTLTFWSSSATKGEIKQVSPPMQNTLEKNCLHSSSFPFLFQSFKPNLTIERLPLKEHLDII